MPAEVSSTAAQSPVTGLAQLLRPGGAFFISNPPPAAAAHLALELAALGKRNVIAITDGAKTLDVLWRDLSTLGQAQTATGKSHISYFPAWESLPGHGAPPPADLIGDRIATLQTLVRHKDGQPAPIIATSVQALMQRTLPPELLKHGFDDLREGMEIEPDHFTQELLAAGYDAQVEVQRKGQFALRGGILDLWPVTAPLPVRVELFGTTIDSMRTFDPVGQRSIDKIFRVPLAPAAEKSDLLTSDLFAYVPADAVWLWIDEEGIHHHAEIFTELIRDAGAEALTVKFVDVQTRIEGNKAGSAISLGLVNAGDAEVFDAGYGTLEELPQLEGVNLPPDVMDKHRSKYIDALRARAVDGWKVKLFFGTEGSRERFVESFGKDSPLQLCSGALSEGFSQDFERVLYVAEGDLFGRRKERRGRYDLHGESGTTARAKVRQASERIVDWTDMQPGELVVHVDHGIGKYLGLFEIDTAGQKSEVLTIEYAEGAKLYLPVGQTHLLSRYIGVGKARPELHTLGGARWAKEKIGAQKAVQDLASMLLETQAARDALEGHAFAKDNIWQHEFEEMFPYQETPDQQAAIDAVKEDMEKKRPMDRLVCGDVGYGKTEVAMRAAFKSVMGGKQVAMLVPTTILAQQHYDSFRERMAAFPVRIECLSRFQSRAEQNDIIDRLKLGKVDIVIGTHRLVQNDVGFKDLGLVIIDEEQKFGVAHKEHLKRLRRLVDVLTLTATPIPRTLYMSLVGARDLSVIETPPMERLPIETIVVPNTDEMVREAVLRELNREGQIYYLHNRVGSIEAVRERLRKLVPEARIEVGHGQMNEEELGAIMRAFVAGRFDILLCTTIIESGLDIPNVNTILIDRADRFGMAELYQLRGRVGRYKRKAYAYFLLPKHGQLFDNARKRIGALRKYSQLGAGFRMAMRDLEIRGAGNVLGAEQSGHIAAVGFDLYCQLLKRTVAAMKGEAIPALIDVEVRLDFLDFSPVARDEANAAAIPIRYIEDETIRVGLYRKIAALASQAEIEALRAEISDRFGKMPVGVERLFKIAALRFAAAKKGVSRIETKEDKILLSRRGDFIMPNGKYPRLTATRPDARLNELAALLKGM